MADTRYTIYMRVTVDGPDAEWDDVARMTAERVEGLSVKRGTPYRIVHAEVDHATEESEDA